MKGKRYTTEDKIRILRDADRGKSILEVCREHNISEVSFHRWKRQFGQMDLNEARKLKELERENGELKKMLAEALLKNRVLEAVAEKNGEPGASQTSGPGGGSAWVVLRADGVPLFVAGPGHIFVPWTATHGQAGPAGQATASLERGAPTVWLPAHCRAFAPRRLASANARCNGYVVPTDCGCHPRAVGSCAKASPPVLPTKANPARTCPGRGTL